MKRLLLASITSLFLCATTNAATNTTESSPAYVPPFSKWLHIKEISNNSFIDKFVNENGWFQESISETYINLKGIHTNTGNIKIVQFMSVPSKMDAVYLNRQVLFQTYAYRCSNGSYSKAFVGMRSVNGKGETVKTFRYTPEIYKNSYRELDGTKYTELMLAENICENRPFESYLQTHKPKFMINSDRTQGTSKASQSVSSPSSAPKASSNNSTAESSYTSAHRPNQSRLPSSKIQSLMNQDPIKWRRYLSNKDGVYFFSLDVLKGIQEPPIGTQVFPHQHFYKTYYVKHKFISEAKQQQRTISYGQMVVICGRNYIKDKVRTIYKSDLDSNGQVINEIVNIRENVLKKINQDFIESKKKSNPATRAPKESEVTPESALTDLICSHFEKK